jgi:nitric oxide reductase large subunit
LELFVRRFIRSSLVWLAVGGLLGVDQMLRPGDSALLRPAHAHANLLGFVSMMIFGVAYHVMPRFTGVPLYSRRLPTWHLWLSNIGILALVFGWWVRGVSTIAGQASLGIGAAGTAAGAALFIFNIWRTLDSVPDMKAAQGPQTISGRRPS